MISDTPDPSRSVIEGLAAWELEHVAAINTYEAKADAPEAEASEFRWLQAEKASAAQDAGMSQQKIADNWERLDGTTYSQSHVKWVLKTWDVFSTLGTRPRWNEAYHSDEVRKTTHVAQNTGENEWYTPPEIIAAAVEVMGGIDLDPASSLAANKTVGAAQFYTKEDSGLNVQWKGRVWLNPSLCVGSGSPIHRETMRRIPRR